MSVTGLYCNRCVIGFPYICLCTNRYVIRFVTKPFSWNESSGYLNDVRIVRTKGKLHVKDYIYLRYTNLPELWILSFRTGRLWRHIIWYTAAEIQSPTCLKTLSQLHPFIFLLTTVPVTEMSGIRFPQEHEYSLHLYVRPQIKHPIS